MRACNRYGQMRYGGHWSSGPIEQGVYSKPLNSLLFYDLTRQSIQKYFASKKFTTGDYSNTSFVHALKTEDLKASHQSNYCVAWMEGLYAEVDEKGSKKCMLCQDVSSFFRA